jgi:imidazoleglycerol phosphate dehydratase HisB
MDGNAAVARDFGDALLQMVERNIHAAIDVLGRPLARISDIQQQRRIGARQLLRHHRGADALGRPHQVRPPGKRFHASICMYPLT